MRLRFILLLTAMVSALAAGCAPMAGDVESLPGAARWEMSLNAGWRFVRKDVAGAEQTAVDDSKWQAVHLPHTWNNLDGQDGGNNYDRGPAWYRRELNVTPELAGKSLFLKFDGASLVADVYVNGQKAGSHKGAFAAFVCDITNLVHPGAGNVIAVRVDNTRNVDVPPLEGDFTVFGGLYRSVHLLALNSLSITPMDDAGPGVYVTQTKVTRDLAQLHSVAKLRNSGATDKVASVLWVIVDAAGQTIDSTWTKQNVPAGGSAEAAHDVSIASPHLWNGRKDPYLYSVRVSVIDDGEVTDSIEQPLGLRFFSVDPDKGFILNGEKYALHGVNRHQDRIDMGWAITPKEHQEDFDLIMEMGCTGIRLAHYQHAQEFYDLCDRGGLVVWAEACMVNTVTASDAFDDAAMEQVREIIKQNYNHPSICFWSLFNELRPNPADPKTDPMTDPQIAHQMVLVGKLNQLAHELDSTRLTTAASHYLFPNFPRNLITDIVAYNGYAGWYRQTPAAWPGVLDDLRNARPGRAVGISEFGAGASIYQHEAAATQPAANLNPWHPEEWQATVHEAAWRAMKDRPWLWCEFLWNMFDFAADQRAEGDQAGRNDKGMVTYDRKNKKDTFYFYKANWSDEKFAYITDRRFTPRNVSAPIKVYSNCRAVELWVNGKSAGLQFGDDIHRFVWVNVELKPGKNELRAVGMDGGKTYEDECTVIYDPKGADRVTSPH
jgi:beta-galactosidase